MEYTEAIEYLRANNIKKDDDTFYEFGDVSCYSQIALMRYLLRS